MQIRHPMHRSANGTTEASCLQVPGHLPPQNLLVLSQPRLPRLLHNLLLSLDAYPNRRIATPIIRIWLAKLFSGEREAVRLASLSTDFASHLELDVPETDELANLPPLLLWCETGLPSDGARVLSGPRGRAALVVEAREIVELVLSEKPEVEQRWREGRVDSSC